MGMRRALEEDMVDCVVIPTMRTVCHVTDSQSKLVGVICVKSMSCYGLKEGALIAARTCC